MAHSPGFSYNQLRMRCQRRESAVSSRTGPAHKLRAENSAQTFAEEVSDGPAPSQRNRFNTFDFSNCARVCSSNQTQAKTMAARKRAAADEMKAKHKTNWIFSDFSFMEFLQSALPWVFRKQKLATFERKVPELAVEEPPKTKQRLDPG